MLRRQFMKDTALAASGSLLVPQMLASCTNSKNASGAIDPATGKRLFFEVSLAEWSLHRALFAGQMTNLDFPLVAKKDYGITAVEYVNQFFKDKAKDTKYLADLKMRCDDNGIKSVLIMCDGEGYLGDADAAKRTQAIENHYKWVEAAKYLGCFCIRVNAGGQGTAEQVADNAADGLRRLTTFAKTHGISVIVENHGGYSSNGKWLVGVMQKVNMKECGILPDFGNFCIKRSEGEWQGKCLEEYDRYLGTKEFMPFAKDVSAKTYDFDEQGNCIETDYRRMLKIVKDAGYRGYIGIEYEGDKLSEPDGIKATLALLHKVGAELS
ncbi:MAG: sugar phosphate isomerase/epimerase [Saprospiraceae bacterium]|nr:sugar phosphate isomerase/epimerase [Saprospiraceae bacterium]